MASTFTYDGLAQTYYKSPSDYNWMQKSYGTKSPTQVTDNLDNYVMMQSFKTTSILGALGGIGINTADFYDQDGLNDNGQYVTVPANGIPYYNTHRATINDDGSYWISFAEIYYDGGYQYSLNAGNPSSPTETMFFTAS